MNTVELEKTTIRRHCLRHDYDKAALSIMIFLAVLAFGMMESNGMESQKTFPAPENAEWQPGPGKNWCVNWNVAVKKARSEQKAIFVLSTGSDWCGWCKKLRAEVFEKKEFQNFADKKLVLLYLDSPHKEELCASQDNHNKYIKKSLSFGGGVPQVRIFSSNGEFLGNISGGGKQLKEYLDALKQILANKGEPLSSQEGQDLFKKGYTKEIAANLAKTSSAENSKQTLKTNTIQNSKHNQKQISKSNKKIKGTSSKGKKKQQ